MTDTIVQAQHEIEVASGQRFEFGKNWNAFLRSLNESKIADAKGSLAKMLGLASLDGKTFLDIGSGSGLFSLAARMLGARVHSFDYDPQSVACAKELRRRYFQDDERWTIESGSVLDANYLSQLGEFDVVYSWGVLHHTGNMWQALESVEKLVSPGGKLYIAIYNDEGFISKIWTDVKRTYNRSKLMRGPMRLGFLAFFRLRMLLKDLLNFRSPNYSTRRYAKRRGRGMSWSIDVVDWIGGYPFEVAKPEQIFDFYRARGFQLVRLFTTTRNGCNEFVFEKR